MESFKELRSKNLLTKFADSNTLGSYDFLSQVIQLNSIEKRHIEELQGKSKELGLDCYNISRCIFPLLSHEQAHWVDSTSTLWGFEFIEKAYQCLSISSAEQINGQSEEGFYIKKTFYDDIHKIKYPRYYSTTGNLTGGQPWRYQYSMGKLFDKSGIVSECPIFFTRFNDINGNLISREPFSLCSILEASATYQELMTEVSLLHALLKDDEALIESELLKQRYMSRIYDGSLTEYSIATHKISNELKLSDVIEAYGLSASLGHLSLNFHPEYFEKINPELIYGEDHPFLEGIKISLRSKDRAVLYMLLCDAVSAKHAITPVSRQNIRVTVQEILSDFSVSLDEMAERVEEKMMEIATNVSSKYRDDYSCNLLITGVGRFKSLGIMAEGLYPFKEFSASGAVLGDDYYFDPYGSEDHSYEDRYLRMSSFLEHLSSFSEACIY